MAMFSSGGSVFDDAVTAGTYGVVNRGAGKDAQRAAAKKEAGLMDESNNLRQEGLQYGDSQFQQIYGTNKEQVGLDMKDILQRRKDTLGMVDPASNQIRQAGNDAVRNATSSLAQSGVKGGMGAQGINKIKREATRDTNAQLTKSYMDNLMSNQQLTGNLATQSQRLPQVYSQLFQGGQYIPPVGQAPFMGGMFDQGVLGGVFS